ncbi:CLUMA_CG010921, isoform A [Clunio marinus]|uniref:CLUMA_CG010921, isoform A n=1 Tax=Clunio marinus TaxID=568069 RepID=A0A1J1IB75_9DIPT|nr:CLUMA_CG010921, isoform A [Clunio marinus]
MAKLPLLFIAVFCFVQIASSARISKREVTEQTTAIEITTESILDKIKNGLTKTFSDDNINQAKQKITDLGERAKDLGAQALNNVQTRIQNALHLDQTSTTTAPTPFTDAATREKRDEEVTTPNILDSIKTGIENALSEQNIKTAVDNLNEFGEKLKVLGTKVMTNVQNALKSDETTAAP